MADEVLAAGNKEQTATADATEFLTNVLTNGPVKVTEIEKEARGRDLSQLSSGAYFIWDGVLDGSRLLKFW
jgi:hypothetical protein